MQRHSCRRFGGPIPGLFAIDRPMKPSQAVEAVEPRPLTFQHIRDI